MPNDCFNRVTIHCDVSLTQDLEVLIDSLQTDELTRNPTNVFNFNSIIQMPPELMQMEERYHQRKGLPDDITKARLRKEHGADNWYDWCVKHWGTKWNSYNSRIIAQDKQHVVYTFDTAWSPPQPIITRLREVCPDFRISAFYDEPGMELAGYL